jgi:putative exporter of polyketide antibiotics
MVVVVMAAQVVNEVDQVRTQQIVQVKAETLTHLVDVLVAVAVDRVLAGLVPQVAVVAVLCVLSGARDVHSRRPMLEL